jgi:hypothetical protein
VSRSDNPINSTFGLLGSWFGPEVPHERWDIRPGVWTRTPPPRAGKGVEACAPAVFRVPIPHQHVAWVSQAWQNVLREQRVVRMVVGVSARGKHHRPSAHGARRRRVSHARPLQPRDGASPVALRQQPRGACSLEHLQLAALLEPAKTHPQCECELVRALPRREMWRDGLRYSTAGVALDTSCLVTV